MRMKKIIIALAIIVSLAITATAGFLQATIMLSKISTLRSVQTIQTAIT